MSGPQGHPLLVTGATGFLGRNIVPILRAAGWRIRAAGRTAPPPGLVDEVALVGDIGPATSWRGALDGAEAVLHLAALAHRAPAMQEREAYFAVNAEGTMRLAQAIAEAGVPHFIFLSSIYVNGSSTREGAPFRPEDPPMPATIYSESKAAAEAGLAEVCAAHGLGCTVIRTPVIYGTGVKANLRLLAKMLRLGAPLPLGGIRNRRAFVSAENVAGFIAHRLATGAAGCETFIVADGEQVSTPEFMRRMARALGRPARLLPVPESLLRGLLKLARRDELIETLLGSLEVDIGKALATGWRPSVTLDEGLARAFGAEADPSHAAQQRRAGVAPDTKPG